MARKHDNGTACEVQSTRKKFVSLVPLSGKGRTIEQYRQALAKTGSLRSHKPKLNESHRAFILSADLALEAEGAKSWEAVTPYDVSSAHGVAVDWFKSMDGPADLVFLFDGRSKTARKFFDEAIEAKPNTSEVWLTYTGPCGVDRISKSQKVSLGSKNREACSVVLPTSPAKMVSSSTFSDMPIKSVKSMPRLAVPAKAKILDMADTEAAESLLPSELDDTTVPLLWQESKSEAFWAALIEEFKIGAIVDATPGAGALATSAMKAGISYVGFVKSQDQLNWLSNLLDKAALAVITQDQSPLFHADLAAQIQKHFADVLEDAMNHDDGKDEVDANNSGEEA